MQRIGEEFHGRTPLAALDVPPNAGRFIRSVRIEPSMASNVNQSLHKAQAAARSPFQLADGGSRIAAGVRFAPLPGALDDRVDRVEARPPTQLAPRARRGCDERRWVAHAARFWRDRNLVPGNTSHGVDHFTVGVAAAAAQVEAPR